MTEGENGITEGKDGMTFDDVPCYSFIPSTRKLGTLRAKAACIFGFLPVSSVTR
jgi:hypothetical protein